MRALNSAVFKKVIGQEANEAQRSSQSAPDQRPSPSASASSESAASGSDSPMVASGPSSSSVKPSTVSTRNVLSSDVEIKGTVKFQHDLIVDGKIEGDIQSTGNLTIGENARIKAEVKTGTIVVYGKVHGNLTATDHIELKASAEVVGDIKTKTLTIESGAIFVGKSTVGTPTTPSGGSSAAQPELKPQSSATQPSLANK
jgi:cytoskeletal protein CcmA (bactofilin family)